MFIKNHCFIKPISPELALVSIKEWGIAHNIKGNNFNSQCLQRKRHTTVTNNAGFYIFAVTLDICSVKYRQCICIVRSIRSEKKKTPIYILYIDTRTQFINVQNMATAVALQSLLIGANNPIFTVKK